MTPDDYFATLLISLIALYVILYLESEKMAYLKSKRLYYEELDAEKKDKRAKKKALKYKRHYYLELTSNQK